MASATARPHSNHEHRYLHQSGQTERLEMAADQQSHQQENQVQQHQVYMERSTSGYERDRNGEQTHSSYYYPHQQQQQQHQHQQPDVSTSGYLPDEANYQLGQTERQFDYGGSSMALGQYPNVDQRLSSEGEFLSGQQESRCANNPRSNQREQNINRTSLKRELNEAQETTILTELQGPNSDSVNENLVVRKTGSDIERDISARNKRKKLENEQSKGNPSQESATISGNNQQDNCNDQQPCIQRLAAGGEHLHYRGVNKRQLDHHNEGYYATSGAHFDPISYTELGPNVSGRVSDYSQLEPQAYHLATNWTNHRSGAQKQHQQHQIQLDKQEHPLIGPSNGRSLSDCNQSSLSFNQNSSTTATGEKLQTGQTDEPFERLARLPVELSQNCDSGQHQLAGYSAAYCTSSGIASENNRDLNDEYSRVAPREEHESFNSTFRHEPLSGGSSGHISSVGLPEDELHQKQLAKAEPTNNSSNNTAGSQVDEYSQLRILEMRKEKSRDAARSRRSKENHEFYELAKLLPLPAAITSQLDFLDKASIIRLTISFLKLRQFSVNGHPPWAPDFTTLGSVNPYLSQSAFGSQQASLPADTKTQSQRSNDTSNGGQQFQVGQPEVDQQRASRLAANLSPSSVAFTQMDGYSFPSNCHEDISPINKTAIQELGLKSTASLFDIHQGTHILQSLDGFAFAVGRDGRFLYISETVSMYLGLSQVEMTGSSVFDYTHQQDHEELARQLGIAYMPPRSSDDPNSRTSNLQLAGDESPQPASVHSQYSAASNETLIDDYVNTSCPRKQGKLQPQQQQQQQQQTGRGAYGRGSVKRTAAAGHNSKLQQASETPLTTLISSSNVMISSTNANSSDNNNNIDQQTGSRASADEQLDSAAYSGTSDDPLVRQFCIRMKSTLTKRGCQHFKSSGYRVVHVVGHLRSYQSNDHGHLMDPLDEQTFSLAKTSFGPQSKAGSKRNSNVTRSATSGSSKSSSTSNGNNHKEMETKPGSTDASSATINETSNLQNSQDERQESMTTTSSTTTTPASTKKPKIIGMVAIAIALPPPSINELKLESDTFVLRLGLDLRITHIEPKITELLQYPVELIAGRSLYSLIHPADLGHLQKCHRELLKKGQIMSGYYRLLSRSGGYIWIQTCATVICNNSSSSSFGPVAGTGSAAASQMGPILAHGSSSPMSQAHFLAPSSSSSSSLIGGQATGTSNNNFNNSGDISQHPGSNSSVNQINFGAKVGSPALSSHMGSSQFSDTQDQDQCVIFVNYMITNIVESDQIIDICQSSTFAPLSVSFPGSGSSICANSNSIAFNSPSSHSASSSIAAGTTPQTIGATGSGSYVASPVIGSPAMMSSSPSRRSQNADNSTAGKRDLQQQLQGKPNGARRSAHRDADQKLAKSHASRSAHLTSGRSAAHTNGHEGVALGPQQQQQWPLEFCSQLDQQQYQQQQQQNNHQQQQPQPQHQQQQQQQQQSYYDALNQQQVDRGDTSTATVAAVASVFGGHYGTVAPSAGVNLALPSKIQQNAQQDSRSRHWFAAAAATAAAHSPVTQTGSETGSCGGASYAFDGSTSELSSGQHQAGNAGQHYSSRANIYKSAFGIDVAGAAGGYGHAHAHQQTIGYPTAAAGWPDSSAAAVAAVAAASNHLSGHHHHHVSAAGHAHQNYAAQLESHSALGAAAATANFHHHHHNAQAANTYYNYYGYYGNKFI